MENKMNTTDTVLIVCGLSSVVVIGLIMYYFLRSKPDVKVVATENQGTKEEAEPYRQNVIHKLRFLFFFLAFLIFVMVLFSGLAYFGTLGYV